jgi:hypothetical protein
VVAAIDQEQDIVASAKTTPSIIPRTTSRRVLGRLPAGTMPRSIPPFPTAAVHGSSAMTPRIMTRVRRPFWVRQADGTVRISSTSSANSQPPPGSSHGTCITSSSPMKCQCRPGGLRYPRILKRSRSSRRRTLIPAMRSELCCEFC